jgi:hypothetical protein
MSREIKIESKRIILMMKKFDRERKRENVMVEEKDRIKNIVKINLKDIEREMKGEDN